MLNNETIETLSVEQSGIKKITHKKTCKNLEEKKLETKHKINQNQNIPCIRTIYENNYTKL